MTVGEKAMNISSSAMDASKREEGNKSYHEAQGRMSLLPNYYQWIISKFRGHIRGVVVELGVGVGAEVAHYLNDVQHVIGVDYNDELLSTLKKVYPENKVEGRKVDLRGDWSELDRETADTVLALDVMEHFEDDRAFASKVFELLKPGGKLCLKVPAQSHLFGAVDEASGHFRRYDPLPLQRLMEEVGFETVSQQYMNPAGALMYRLKRNKKSNYSKTFSPSSLRLINRFMPIIASFDRVPALPGLSLTGIYRRPLR